MRFCLILVLVLIVVGSTTAQRKRNKKVCERNSTGQFTYNCGQLKNRRYRSRCLLTQKFKCGINNKLLRSQKVGTPENIQNLNNDLKKHRKQQLNERKLGKQTKKN